MPVFLHGLALRNFRGIGPNLQRMGPFRDFNIFIGANNSGKSGVLNYISRFLPLPIARSRIEPSQLQALDQYAGATGSVEVQLGIPQTEFVRAARGAMRNSGERAQQLLNTLCENFVNNGLIWLLVSSSERAQVADTNDVAKINELLDDRDWRVLWNGMSGRSGGDILEHWIPDSLQRLADAQKLDLPPTNLIPAIRQIGPKSENFADFSGRGLIDRLAQIQSPDHDKRHERLLFDRINKFLQDVTDHTEAQIEIPHNREHVLVHMDGKVLPLGSLGTGIQEVIMLAAFCTISERQIVCIEEPELHLHPLLQRKLMRYLSAETTNQYFIATHSPTFIDTQNAAIFHVRQLERQTVIKESVLRSERFAICIDLGHRASDLLQANCVIWVEGPSDRIYLQHWLGAAASDLIEGIHYSIMFYGGRLLSHLTAEDDEVTAFISLKALNQNCAIVMDSDRASASDQINATKTRIEAEFNKGGEISWVTAGREIENYVQHQILQDAVKSVYPMIYDRPCAGGKFDHALHFHRSRSIGGTEVPKRRPIEKDIDKVKVAREVCRNPPNLDVLDLRTSIAQLVQMIRNANGRP